MRTPAAKSLETLKGHGVHLPGKTELRKFQREFVRRAMAPGVDIAALSLPRGNGKSWLAAYLLTRALTPGDDLYRAGAEYLLCAASIPQARLCFRFIRADLEPTGEYRFIDSATRIGIRHLATGTTLRVLSSNGKTGMGIVGCPLLIADEPGSWETNGGQLMADAIDTALGKPGSPMKVIYIGTLAPAVSGWWHDLIAGGSHGSTYVQSLRGDPAKWDRWPEIRRVNPLTAISPDFRRKLLEERDAARGDTRLRARFQSYRLNLPSADESQVLLTVDDWERMIARPVPPRAGQPIVAIDLGAGRAWSSAVAMWQNGRTEALALAPGIPDIEAQERRDRAPRGTYGRLVASGLLHLADNLRVQPAGMLVDLVRERWGSPAGGVLCDRFRVDDLRDAGINAEPRVTRWSESSEDIRALRKLSADGPMTVAPESRPLLAASLGVALVANDTSGNVRLIKKSHNNTARDDVAASLCLVAGAYQRRTRAPVKKGVYRGKVA